jgi:holo-ACP synthase
MVGGVKLNRISRTAFEQGCSELISECERYGATIRRLKKYITPCGPELLAAVGGIEPILLKRLLVNIEENHRLGRLFDIDVLDVNGMSLSREDLDLPRRKCLVCGEDAKICARSRAHPLSTLIDKMSEMINDCNEFN